MPLQLREIKQITVLHTAVMRDFNPLLYRLVFASADPAGGRTAGGGR